MEGVMGRPVLVKLITKTKTKNKNKIQLRATNCGVGGASALSACLSFALHRIANTSSLPDAPACRPRTPRSLLGEGKEVPPECSLLLARQAQARSTGRTSSSPPFVHSDRLGDSNASLLPTYAVYHNCTCAGCHPVLFHHCGTTNQRAPCVCQWRRRGWAHPDITKPWTGAVLLRHRCAPLWWLTSLVFHHSPRNALIASQLRTRCIQSIREAGPSIPTPGM